MSSIIKDSSKLKQSLLDRWAELKIQHTMVVRDAKKRKRKGITSESISKWIKDPYLKGSLNEENIVWLCFRWQIRLSLAVGDVCIIDGKISTYIPPYEEKKAIELLNTIFPAKR